jgi:hypothetical protein
MTDNQTTPSKSAESTRDSEAASSPSKASEERRKIPKLKDINIEISPETTRYLNENMQLD